MPRPTTSAAVGRAQDEYAPFGHPLVMPTPNGREPVREAAGRCPACEKLFDTNGRCRCSD